MGVRSRPHEHEADEGADAWNYGICRSLFSANGNKNNLNHLLPRLQVNIKQNNVCILMCFENCQALKQRVPIIIVFLNTQGHNVNKMELKCPGS